MVSETCQIIWGFEVRKMAKETGRCPVHYRCGQLLDGETENIGKDF